VVLTLTVVAAAVISPTAADALLSDASCLGPPDSGQTVLTDQRQAQTYTAQHSAYVVEARTEINKSAPGGNFQMQIYSVDPIYGFPSSPISGPAVIPDASVPTGNSTLVGHFPPGNLMGQGLRYALVITRPAGASFTVRDRGGDPCPGQEFQSSSQTGPWNPSDPAFDFVFQLTVNPLNLFSVGPPMGRRLPVTVPGAGTITAADALAGKKGRARSAMSAKLLRRSSASASGAGTATVILRPTKAGKRLLAERGSLVVKVAVTYTPTGGDPATSSPTLRIRPHGKLGSFVKRP